MTNYEILKGNGDILAEMEERLHKECWCCTNYKMCGEPKSKPSKEVCKAMWRSYFKGADTFEKVANRMLEASSCTECPAAGMCGEIKYFCECEDTIIAWLRNENWMYSLAVGKH